MEKIKKQRTPNQNNALHKYCSVVADELNNHGISMKILLSDLEVDHTMESVKSIFRAIGKAKFGKVSTSDLSTDEITKVYEEMNRMLANSHIHVSFPSYEQQEQLKHYEKIGI